LDDHLFIRRAKQGRVPPIPLHDEIRRGCCPSCLRRLLDEAGDVDVDEKDSDGYTPFTLACRHNKIG
jgi:ankyrin repeat protein